MSLEEVFDVVWNYLTNEVRYNYSLNELKKRFLDMVNSFKGSKREDYNIEISKIIYDEVEEIQDDERIYPSLSENNNCIVAIEFSDSSLYFSLNEGESCKVTLMSSNEKELYEEIIIDLDIMEDKSVWHVIKSSCDELDYYYSYDVDCVIYDKKHNIIMKDEALLERIQMFSEFFGISEDDARKCIGCFDENKDFLNNSKVKLEMNLMDDMFSQDYNLFSKPFKMIELESVFLSNIDDEYKDSRQLIIFYDRLDTLVKTIYSSLGKDGDYVMSYNLFMNIIHYLTLNVDVLNTSGYFIKKWNDEYTIFNVSLCNDSVMIIPSSVSKEDVQLLYKSADANKDTDGLSEFFGIDNSKKLK